jgi:hypothetical protein
MAFGALVELSSLDGRNGFKLKALPQFAWIMLQGERAGGAGRSWRDRTSDA